MKLRTRVFSILLTLALLVSATPLDLTLASARAAEVEEATATPEPVVISEPVPEEVYTEPEATEEPPVETEAPPAEPEATEEPQQEAEEPAQPTAEVEVAPEATEEPQQEGEAPEAAATPVPTEDPNAIDYTADAGKSPAFVLGYAEVREDDTPAYADARPEAEEAARLGRGVVYVLERTAPNYATDRLHIAFNAGGEFGIVEGWVNADRVRPMEPETEVPAYLKYCAEQQELRFYKNLAELPLVRIACAFPEPDADEPEATAEPTEVENQEAADPNATEHPAFLPEEPAESGAPEISTMPLPLDEPLIELEDIEPQESGMPVSEDGQDVVEDEQTDAGDETSTMPVPQDEPLFDASEISPEISQASLKLYAGRSQQLNMKIPQGQTPVLTSSNIRVATVSADGVVTAITPGEATITLAAGDGADTCEVDVIPALLAVNSGELRVGVGERIDLTEAGIVTCASELPMQFTSSNDGCVIVTGNGVLTSIAPGEATISIRVPDSAENAALRVRVEAKATAVSIVDHLELCEGASANLDIELTGGYSNYTLSCSPEGIVTVAEDGTVTANRLDGQSEASATVTIATANGLVDTCAVTVRKAPETIELEEDEITLTEGETGRRIVATAYDGEGNPVDCEFEYAAKDAEIVRISNGLLVSPKVGETEITVTAKDFPEAEPAVCSLAVIAGATGINLKRKAITLGLGDTFQINDIIEPVGGEVALCSYVSSRPKAVEVSSEGLITVLKAGKTADITITPAGAAAQHLAVTTKNAASSVTFSPSEITVGPGGTAEVSVTFPADSAADYRLTSSDTGNAYIKSIARKGDSDTWKIAVNDAFEPATVTLRVETVRGSLLDTCPVHILPGPKSADEIEITAPAVIGVGEAGGKVTAALKSGVTVAGGFTYTSNNQDALEVKADGTLIAKKASNGRVKITATAKAPHAPGAYASAEIEIEVVEKATVDLNKGASYVLKLGIGDTYSLNPLAPGGDPDGILKIEPAGARMNLSYDASKKNTAIKATDVLTVDANGLITAKAKGDAYVRVSSGDKTLWLKVNVSKATSSIALSASSKTIGLGMKNETLTVSFSGAAKYGHFTAESSNKGVLEVTPSGTTLKLTPKGEGTATVTVRTSKNQYVDSCAVTVLPAPSAGDVTLLVPEAIGVGEAGQKVSASYDVGKFCAALSFKSDATDKLDVNATTGALTAKAGGEARISVYADGGNVALATETVKVVQQPTSMKLVPDTITIENGQTCQIDPARIVKLTPAESSASYSYKASAKKGSIAATSVIKVSASGLITAKSKGTAYVRIHADNANNVEEYLAVKVVAKNTSFKFSNTAATLAVGMKTAPALANAPAGTVTFVSDPEGIVVDDGNGFTFTAKKPGTAKVVAKVGEVETAIPMAVTVLPAPTKDQIYFTEDSTKRISANQKGKITAVCAEGTTAGLNYAIEGEAPQGISINKMTGELTAGADAPATGEFTVKAYDMSELHPDVSATMKVQMVPAGKIKQLRKTEISLGVGETLRFSDDPDDGIIVLEDPDTAASYNLASYKEKNCTTANSKFVTLDAAAGTITGKKAGTNYIKITNSGDASNSVVLQVNVYALPASATLTPAVLTLGVGMTGTLTTNYTSGYGFTISDNAGYAGIATVADAGDGKATIAAKAEGYATVTVKSWDGKSDTALVHVVPAPDAITVAPDTLTIGVNETAKLAASIASPAVAMAEFTYELENKEEEQYLTVNSKTGELTGKKVKDGVKVTVKAKGTSVAATATVDVVAAPAKLSLTTLTLEMGKGNTYQISELVNGGIVKVEPEGAHAQLHYYASAKKNKNKATDVISVSSTGLITANAKGTAYVRIWDQRGDAVDRTAVLTVNVSKLATSATLSASELKLGVGMNRDLKANFPANAKTLYTLTSSEATDGVIHLDATSGRVTALKPGEATVTMRTVNGLTDTCHITVVGAPTSIDWEFVPGTCSNVQQQDGAYVIGVGELNARIVAKPNPADALADFHFAVTGDTSALKVAGNGALTAVNTGTANVTVSASSAPSVPAVTVPVKVVAAPTKKQISLRTTQLKMGVGDTFQISEYDADENPDGIIELLDKNCSASYTYKSMNTAVATVSASGLVTAVSKGTAVIRVRTQNTSIYKELTVTVSKFYTESLTISPASVTLGPGMSATLTPEFSEKGFGMVEYSCNSDKLILNMNPATGACSVYVNEKSTITAEETVTITARLLKPGETDKTDTCAVTLLPAPEEIGIDFDTMKEKTSAVEKDEKGEYLRVGLKEAGAQIIPKVVKPAKSRCTYDYTVDPQTPYIIIAADGALTVKKNCTPGWYTITVKASNSDATATVRLEVVAGPSSISFASTPLTLGVGDTYQLTEEARGGLIRLSPATASASYSYAKSGEKNRTTSTKVIDVTSTGVITAKKQGTAFVKVTAQNGTYKVLKVVVQPAPASIGVSIAPAKLGELSSGKATVTYPQGGYSLPKSFESGNKELLTIDDEGNFTIGKLNDSSQPGKVTVTATTQSGCSATTEITVLPHPDEVHFTEESYTVSEGMSLETAILLPENTMAQSFEYKSSNPEVAEIDPKTGVITGVNGGDEGRDTTITVTANPGAGDGCEVSGEATVTVKPAPRSISYEGLGLPDVLRISKGDTITLPEPVARSANGTPIPATYTYALNKASDKDYVTISGNKLTALKKSDKDIVINVAAQNEVSTTLTVQVFKEEITAVRLFWEGIEVGGSEEPIPMYIDDGDHQKDSIQLTAEVVGTNLNYGEILFSSSNEDAVTVDAQGLVSVVTANKKTEEPVTITATALNGGKSAGCQITVGTLATSYELTSTSIRMPQAATESITAKFTPDDAGMRFSYKSKDEKIVAVERNGKLTSFEGGKTTVDVTDQLGKTTSVDVNVLHDPTSIGLPVHKLYMKPGDTVTLTPVLAKENVDAKDINVWTEAESDSELVTVEEEVPRNQDEGTPASYIVTAGQTEKEAKATISICADGPAQPTVTCEIIVTNEAKEIGFDWDASKKLIIMQGDSAEIEYSLTAEAFNKGAGSEGGYTIAETPNEDGELLTVDAKSGMFTANKVGKTTLTLTVGETAKTAEIEVIAPVAPVVYQRNESSGELNVKVKDNKATVLSTDMTDDLSQTRLRVDALPEHTNGVYLLLGIFDVKIDDLSLLSYKSNTDCGTAQAGAEPGVTTLTVTTFGGTVEVEVTILRTAYRALLISEWNGEGGASMLPFAQTNIDLMKSTLESSRINGQSYSVKTLQNANADGINNKIKNTFSSTKDGDVSVVYIVAHGNINGSGEYWFSGANNISVTASQLMKWVHTYIKGKVVLIIDSCNSGQFIVNQGGNIDKYGNIAVICAQVAYKNASYYTSYKGISDFEFFTRAFCACLGKTKNVGSADPWKNKSLDADSNGDKNYTVKEVFSLSKSTTTAMVNKYCYPGTPWFYQNSKGFTAGSQTSTLQKITNWYNNGESQKPQSKIPDALKNLVFFGKK